MADTSESVGMNNIVCGTVIANKSVTEDNSLTDLPTLKKETTLGLQPAKVPVMNRIKGISLFVLASLCSTTNGALVKFMEGIPTGEIVFIMSMYAVLFFGVIITYEGVSMIRFSQKKWVLLRVLGASAAILCKVWSVQNLPLGNANALIFTSPIMTCVLARIFLKEKINPVHIFAILAGLGGLILIAKPTFIFPSDVTAEVPLWYNAVPILGAIFLSVAYVSQRFIGTAVSGTVVAAYGVFFQMLAGLLLQTVTGSSYVNPPCFTYRGLLPFCGLTLGCIFMAVNKGLSYEKAATVSLIRNLDTVLAFFLQVVAFGVPAEPLSLVGAALIMLGTIILTLSKIFGVDCGIKF